MGQSRAEHDLALYAHGFALMNHGAFHAAHDAWEDLWLRQQGPWRAFLQGLIQSAAAWHHAEAQRWQPAVVLVARVGQAWAPWHLATCIQGFALQQAWDGLCRAADAWRLGQSAPPPHWAFQWPTAEEFAPLVGRLLPSIPGHSFAWALALESDGERST